ncbi:junctional sarcoplasmic reticulum protein 1 [Cynocephalus volans]|uniref:junctional sarcoplasmic reticulum protein 1 n=1 Tax=Cynocephalus volans TaxID=110931 RepID=UPI002FC6D294
MLKNGWGHPSSDLMLAPSPSLQQHVLIGHQLSLATCRCLSRGHPPHTPSCPQGPAQRCLSVWPPCGSNVSMTTRALEELDGGLGSCLGAEDTSALAEPCLGQPQEDQARATPRLADSSSWCPDSQEPVVEGGPAGGANARPKKMEKESAARVAPGPGRERLKAGANPRGAPVRKKAQSAPPPPPPPPSEGLPWGHVSLNKCLVLASLVALLGSAFQLCRGEPGAPRDASSCWGRPFQSFVIGKREVEGAPETLAQPQRSRRRLSPSVRRRGTPGASGDGLRGWSLSPVRLPSAPPDAVAGEATVPAPAPEPWAQPSSSLQQPASPLPKPPAWAPPSRLPAPQEKRDRPEVPGSPEAAEKDQREPGEATGEDREPLADRGPKERPRKERRPRDRPRKERPRKERSQERPRQRPRAAGEVREGGRRSRGPAHGKEQAWVSPRRPDEQDRPPGRQKHRTGKGRD